VKAFCTKLWVIAIQTLLSISLIANAYAHKPSDAFMIIESLAESKTVSIRLSLALTDIDAAIESLDENQDRQLTFSEFKAASGAIESLVKREVVIHCGATPLSVAWQLDDSSESSALEKRNDGTYARLKTAVTCALPEAVHMQYRLFELIDTTHRLLVTNMLGSVESLQVASPSEKTFLLRAGGGSNSSAVDVGKANASGLATLFTFIVEGFTHLAIGWDHLAFILVLVLPFTLWRRNSHGLSLDWPTCKRLLFVISAFTVGHCVTLVLVTLQIITVTGRWIEPTIALTIVVSAALNLMPDLKALRIWIPLVFGTIHGLGFSTVLSELDISAGSRLMALIGFNLGIEFGQIAFVASWALAQYWLIRWSGYLRWVVMGGSAILMLAAIMLTIIRTSS
jgi:hypothetical protein